MSTASVPNLVAGIRNNMMNSVQSSQVQQPQVQQPQVPQVQAPQAPQVQAPQVYPQVQYQQPIGNSNYNIPKFIHLL